MALILNKKAHFNYELMEIFETGISLLGQEVKSLKTGHGSLLGAHIIVRGGEAYIVGMHIPPYQPSNTQKEYDPDRTRKLLLTKKELGELSDAEAQKRLTIVPISVYSKGRKLKLQIAIARGKKKYDKRETLKKRAAERDAGRTLKN